MVTLSFAQSSNTKIASSLPAGMVAVFVGGTSGIGEYTLKSFARHTKSPKIYLVGRSQDAADRIALECTKLNPDGDYIFIQSDVSLLKNVQGVCEQILSKEASINLLFQTQGGLQMEKTSEGLSKTYALPFASRMLFAITLLPAIQNASGLRRVVSVFAAGYEGHFDEKNWAEHVVKHPIKARAHLASMITMAHNVLAEKAPDVSFVHNFPGGVKTPFGKGATGVMAVARTALTILGPLFLKYRSPEDSSVLQLYCATSAAFPPAAAGNAAGVPLLETMTVSVGADGKPGSGRYNIDENCEKVPHNIERSLAQAKADGVEERLWSHVLGEIKQITGQVF